MSNSTIQSLTNKFIEKPSYLDKGAGHLADTFKTTRKNIYAAKDEARKKIHQKETENLRKKIKEHEDIINKKFNSKGECEIDGLFTKRITSLEDLITACKIDTAVWEVDSWECNKWEVGRKQKEVNWTSEGGKGSGNVKDTGKIFVEPLFQVKCKLKKISGKSHFEKEFTKFLSTYTPTLPVYQVRETLPNLSKGILILPKQDAHFNRVDVKGRNDINERFKQIEDTTMDIVNEAAVQHSIDKITYIVGSDQFNSEWNNLTTGGTPQQNLLSYQDAFKAICNHEVTIVENLCQFSDHVEILLVPGNHDEYAGWHLVNWLECHFKNHPSVTITEGNIDDPRRYERYGKNGIMYDHGATMNGKELAQRFPIEFRENWSKCDHFYIFSGDKHHEMSLDVHGIKYYRVPALTASKSKWEHRKGYLTPGEMQVFLLKEGKGLTNVYCRLLE